MTELMRDRSFADFMDRTRKGETADWLVVAIALMLPWSTTAVAILVPLWLIALLASLDVASVRRELMTPAGGLPVLLWALAAAGMLWANVEWSERMQGLRGYHKLLAIPLLLAQFRRSDRAKWVIYAFLFSSLVLLTLSWLTPYRGFLGRPKAEYGVPFKDYISQSGIFAICAFGLLGQAAEWWRMQRRRLAAAALIVAAIFVANIVFMATARSTLLVMAVLLLLFGFLQFRWKGVLAVVLLAVALVGVSWVASPYLRERVTDLIEETQDYRASGAATSVGLRLEFWKKSADFVAAAPLVGHGTGTIGALFRRDSTGHRRAGAVVTDNPHNQILAVAIQLGLVGAAALIAMWIAHLALFRERTLIAWFGLTIVIGNIVSCLFHTHIVDTGQGWLYVFGVGMLGGAVLRGKANVHVGWAKAPGTG
jgi:O-antigen ligase